MNVGSLFSGAGLFDVGFAQAGFRHAWGCESDEWRRELWSRRFAVPCYPDIRELRGTDIEPVDVLAGGFPCRGVSSAGKREGFGHPGTALWWEYERIICEIRPRYVVVENVANLVTIDGGGLFRAVLGSLAALGYSAWWDVLPAAAFGAPHLRKRVFIIAHANGSELQAGRNGGGTDDDQARAGDVATDAPSASRQGARPGRKGLGRTAADGRAVIADAQLRRHPSIKPTAGRRQATDPAIGCDSVTADPESVGCQGRSESSEPPRASGSRGNTSAPAFDWRDYGPAIRRWESILGRNAPPPLTGVHRLDDGNPALSKLRRRVDRSRLSAHGDGVLVQAGHLLGRMLMEFEQSSVTAKGEAALVAARER